MPAKKYFGKIQFHRDNALIYGVLTDRDAKILLTLFFHFTKPHCAPFTLLRYKRVTFRPFYLLLLRLFPRIFFSKIFVSRSIYQFSVITDF